jgi:hypothetical protein
MLRITAIVTCLAVLACPVASQAQTTFSVGPDFTPQVKQLSDDFSAARVAEVEVGSFSHPSFDRLEVSINVSKGGGQTLYGLLLTFREMRMPGEVYSVAARGGLSFEPFSSGRSGRLNCSVRRRSYCTSFFLQTFLIPEEVLADLAAGRDVDVQVRTNEPHEGTVIISVPHSAHEALRQWAADH